MMTPDQWESQRLRRTALHEAAHATVLEALCEPLRGLSYGEVLQRAHPHVRCPEDFGNDVVGLPWSRLGIDGRNGWMRPEIWAMDNLTPVERAVLNMAGPIQDWLTAVEDDEWTGATPLSFIGWLSDIEMADLGTDWTKTIRYLGLTPEGAELDLGQTWKLFRGRRVAGEWRPWRRPPRCQLGPVIVGTIELLTRHQARVTVLAELLLQDGDGDGYFQLGSWEVGY